MSKPDKTEETKTVKNNEGDSKVAPAPKSDTDLVRALLQQMAHVARKGGEEQGESLEQKAAKMEKFITKPMENVRHKLKFAIERYDPYAFLDQMATPFEAPGDPKKKFDMADNSDPEKRPHCKTCTDFKTWMKLTANPRRHMSREEREEKECPMDSELLGRNTWSFLHTMAAYYPTRPTPEQQTNMQSFIKLFAMFYPCQSCAAHLREALKHTEPDPSSNRSLSQWFCELHNEVNMRLGKPEFDCSRVFERWRDGWKDGSCD